MVSRALSCMCGVAIVAVSGSALCLAAEAGTAGRAGMDAPFVRMAAKGKALLPVVVSAKASERTKAAAERLVEYLSRISGAEFALTTGDLTAGIGVGLAAEAPAGIVSPQLDADMPAGREDYVLRSHAGGLCLLGATDLAVEHAVWDLLYRLGHRQFFPGPHWEVVPTRPELGIAVDVRQRPDYAARRIWYGYGAWDYAAGPYADWCAKNRATSGIKLNTGHAYDGILRANKRVFAEHPEYLGLVDGERKSTKFCIANPGLRKLVADHAVRLLEKKPDLDSVSVDPSDGGGWCQCAECAKLGSVSDRVITLANAVAEAVTARKRGTLVGVYAYSHHSPPPTIKAHPAVVVSVATAFIKGGWTVNELIRGWSAKASTLGIREYYGVNTWCRDLPAAARGGDLAYLKRTIPAFHAAGAKFMSAESGDNWGPNGLGYYLAARMLFDVTEAGQIDALIDDFLARAFGPAKDPMRAFYEQLDASRPHLLASDQLGRMFRSLAEARERAADSPAVLMRIDDLTQYARYVDLYTRYAKAKAPARQKAFEALIRHAYRMRTTMLVHTKALYRDLVRRDKSVTIPDGATWQVPEAENPWKSSRPFEPRELARFLAEGIERYPLATIGFKPIAFSKDLVSARSLELPSDLPRGDLGSGRGKQMFYTRVERAPAKVTLRVTGGLIAHYRDRGNVRIEAWKIDGAGAGGQRETLSASDRSVPPDGKEHTVTLFLKEVGLYRIALSDGKDRTRVDWDPSLAMTVRSAADDPMNSTYAGPWLMYFYVPKGTRVVGLFGGEHGEIRDAADRPLFWLNGREPGYYSVGVPDGQDGRLWSIRYGRRAVRLLTVPPYLARSPAELLLPAEVVEKDAGK